MQTHTRPRLLFLLAVIMVAACGSNQTHESGDSSCSVGEECRLSGTLTILRGVPASVGVLDTEAGCVPLALPPEIYKRYERWDDRRVVVTGESFAQQYAENVLWIELKDRQVAVGGCGASPVIIYVTGIETL